MSGTQKYRCVVIQLARIGDTLQSLMALRAAKQLYPNLEIHFIARESFADAARRVPWIKAVHTLDSDALMKPVIEGKATERQTMKDLARWLQPLVEEPWDFVVNWTFSESSSYLACLLPGRVKLGYSRTADGSISAQDGWSHFVQSVVQNGLPQNIHLTDILTTQLLTALQIHIGDPADAGHEAVTSKSFFNLELNGEKLKSSAWRDHTRKWVGIQLGAGNPVKTWDPERWAQVASSILGRHPEVNIVLMGGTSESPLATRFMSALKEQCTATERVVSLVGETGFDLWATLVSRCQWVLSCDTSVVHLASILGTRVMNLSIGPVRWMETGPYGNGHYVIASAKPCAGCEAHNLKDASAHTCREDVTPQAVYGAWSYASSEWAHRRSIDLPLHLSRLGYSEFLHTTAVLRSKIRNTQDGGGVYYEPLTARPMKTRDWAAQVNGSLARNWYCGWLPPIAQEITRPMVDPELVRALRGLNESNDVMIKITSEAVRSARELHSKAKSLKSVKVMPLEARQGIADIAAKLKELDSLMARLSVTHPELAIFPKMLEVLMHNLPGEDLADLGKESAYTYDQLKTGAELYKEWINQTLALARPVALASVANSKDADVAKITEIKI